MSDLTEKKCLPCEGGVLPFDISEIHKYQKNRIKNINRRNDDFEDNPQNSNK